ncbi:Transposon TX1 uncharacterized 82 kDa protein [Labeo rohita]|uniref:Transposon TX1 uncharacterized 82 kDa protein n=1 Tax=Labeo rohita TaxID=84645 RepID=A0ABQ8L6W3_LABRO|nr:Transposon TX1 uncharacterized 82 kDa protein [Labeo rohita]
MFRPLSQMMLLLRNWCDMEKLQVQYRMIPLGCKNTALKHVLPFRLQIFMFLTSPERTLEISFRVNHGEGSYIVYVSTDNLKCFECGDLVDKWFSCPHKNASNNQQQSAADMPQNGSNANNKRLEVTVTPHAKGRLKHEVSESDNNANIDERAGCSSAFDMHPDNPDKVNFVDDTEERDQTNIQAFEGGSGDEFDGLSQCSDDSMSLRDEEQWSEEYEMTKANKGDMYTGKCVEVGDFFPDLDKSVASVMWARKVSSDKELSQQKRYRLRKHITAI